MRKQLEHSPQPLQDFAALLPYLQNLTTEFFSADTINLMNDCLLNSKDSRPSIMNWISNLPAEESKAILDVIIRPCVDLLISAGDKVVQQVDHVVELLQIARSLRSQKAIPLAMHVIQLSINFGRKLDTLGALKCFNSSSSWKEVARPVWRELLLEFPSDSVQVLMEMLLPIHVCAHLYRSPRFSYILGCSKCFLIVGAQRARSSTIQ